MKPIRFSLLLFLLAVNILIHAQRTETAVDFSNKMNRLYFDMDNDMLFSTDSYYTAGIGISYTRKELKHTPAQLVWKLTQSTNLSYTGFGIQQRIFTPSSITEPDLIENDQPYSAYIMASNFSISINPTSHLKLSNELGIGIMGPAAGGGEMQTFVHQIVGSPSPIGWENQLQNTFLIDYQFRVEKGIFNGKIANHIIPFAEARIGTLTNRLKLGMMIKLGNRNIYFASIPSKETKLIYEWVFSANFMGVLYDATLQGSMFKDDPNAIGKSEIVSHQYQFRTGFNAYYKRFTIRYMLNFNSSNLNSTIFHRYGSMVIGYSF